MSDCLHINLIKQVGALDGGPQKSTRYRCRECGEFFVLRPYEVVVTIGPPPSAPKSAA